MVAYTVSLPLLFPLHTAHSLSEMAWYITTALAAFICCAAGQRKYAAYQGPPVVPVITKDGFLADTKEVADAKQYFLNALAKTAAEVRDDGPRGYTGSSHLQRVYQPVPLQQGQYQQAQQYQPVQLQQAQYQQLQQYQPVSPTHQPQPQPQPQRYTQPQATPLYRPQPTRPAPVYEDDAQYDDGEYRDEPQYSPLPKAYPTPTRPDPNVTPIILENGYIADTHEVNAAKAEHFAAVARAQELVARAQQRAAQTGYQGHTVAPALLQPQQPQAQAYAQAPAEY